MNVYGTPPPVIPLHEAAAAANLSEDDLLGEMTGNGKRPVIVGPAKLAVTPTDLDEVSSGASTSTVIRQAAAIGPEASDNAEWGIDFIPELTIDGTPVLTGQDAEVYDGFTATAAGGDQPYTYSLVGTWPTGLAIDSETGEVSGTPTEDGTFASLSVRVTDDAGSTADLDTFTIEVAMAE